VKTPKQIAIEIVNGSTKIGSLLLLDDAIAAAITAERAALEKAEQRAKLAETEANAARRILNRMGGYTGHDDPVSVWLANCDIYRAARTARKGKKEKP